MKNQGIIYTKTGEDRRGVVCDYHRKPNALFLNKTKHAIDVAGLKPTDKRQAIKFDGAEYSSKFTIGFEVEKNKLNRSAVQEHELFCGFEYDRSCGYEAVTHVLPLLPSGKWRTKVFDMMHKAEKIIDDRFSPSDRRCGGHVTVACEGMTANELINLVRKNSGIVMALFRNRLKNGYCGDNKRMVADWYGGRYQMALAKGECLEFRVVSKFESVKQMMRRYELFYELINFSVNNQDGKFDAFLKIVRPIVKSMYSGDDVKTDEILGLARHFQKFINDGDVHAEIAQYI